MPTQPRPSYRLRHGRVWHAVSELPAGERRPMIFIKEGSRYVPPEEWAAEAFHDERLNRWLRSWGC